MEPGIWATTPYRPGRKMLHGKCWGKDFVANLGWENLIKLKI